MSLNGDQGVVEVARAKLTSSAGIFTFLRPIHLPPPLPLSHLQGFSKLANGAVFDKKPRSDLRMLFSAASPEAIDLMEKLLTFDPRKRITAKGVRSLPVRPLSAPHTRLVRGAAMMNAFRVGTDAFTSQQSLYHPYFHTSPPATHPSKLPMPSAGLVPRALPPEEIGAPLDAKGRKELKRKSEGDELPGQKKVARKLDFGEPKNAR